MPVSSLEIASANANDALRENRFIQAKLDGIINVLMKMEAIVVCGSCNGKGVEHPAYAVPSCKTCKGAGFTPAR